VKVDILPDPPSADSAGSADAGSAALPKLDPKKKIPAKTPAPAAKDPPKEKEGMLKPGMAVQVHFLVEAPPT
jgi:hypothetical protein